MILIVLLYMLGASTFTLAKAALAYTQPIFFIGVRMIIAGVLLLGFLMVSKITWRFERRHYFLLAQIIVFHIYCAFVLEFIGLKAMTSSKACLIYSLAPFLTALLSYWFFAERLTKRKWAGLIIGFIGFCPIMLKATPTEGATYWGISVPEILMILAVFSSAYGWIVMKRLMQQGYSPVALNGISMLGGGLLAFMTSAFFEWNDSALLVTNMVAFVGYTAALIIVANLIFYNLYGALLYRYSATFISFAGFICPLFAALYGMFFLGEQISWWFFVAVIMIALGLYLFYQEELKQGVVLESK
jgi:drug/metabolite transporter (DMT)-like permease